MFVDERVEKRLESTVLITGKSERRKQNYRQTLCEYRSSVLQCTYVHAGMRSRDFLKGAYIPKYFFIRHC